MCIDRRGIPHNRVIVSQGPASYTIGLRSDSGDRTRTEPSGWRQGLLILLVQLRIALEPTWAGCQPGSHISPVLTVRSAPEMLLGPLDQPATVLFVAV